MRDKRHFNQVDWLKLRKSIKLVELKKKLKRYRALIVDDPNDANCEHADKEDPIVEGHVGHL